MHVKNICNVICLTLLLPCLLHAGTVSEAKRLITRVLPGSANSFIVEEIKSTETNNDIFEIEAAKNGKIILRGNNPVSVATAFNWYLKYYAHISYDWQAQKPLSCKHLPVPEQLIRKVCNANERFFNNTCTFGYTFPFWKWDKWQRFIDWMAMNGINRPLMQAGQEAIWLNVWKSFGIAEKDIQNYFSGPAHLPWHRMANMDSWGGPLPESYIEGQKQLQQKILSRSRALGMKPILTAFAGHVPKQLKDKLPKAQITQIAPGWGGMDKQYTTYFLDPTDSLFAEIQKRFLNEQKRIYGTNHLYSADPFNEITPPSWEPSYLAKVGGSIYKTMSAADEKATWYQMSWTFYYDSIHWTQPRLSAMIHAVPKGKLIFLDYAAEEQEYFRKSNNFEGAPFIWCYLGNFGGNTHLVAPIKKVSSKIINSIPVKNCIGIGSTLEGINVNPIIYELVLELAWHDLQNFDLQTWVDNYAERRCNNQEPEVTRAWQIMSQKILTDSAIGIWNHSTIYQMSPVLDIKQGSWTTNPHIPYNNMDLALVLEQLLKAHKTSANNDAYAYDLVNITRQVLGNYGLKLHAEMVKAYVTKDTSNFRLKSNAFILLGFEIDSLLGSRPEFRLDNWLSDAGKWGKNSSEAAYYQRNAREIITTWHKAGGVLTDYSNRQWNELMRTYYLPRWIKFIALMNESLELNQPINAQNFREWSINFEENWVNNNSKNAECKKKCNAIEISSRLYQKYKTQLLSN